MDQSRCTATLGSLTNTRECQERIDETRSVDRSGGCAGAAAVENEAIARCGGVHDRLTY
jgi:hypothetical protein